MSVKLRNLKGTSDYLPGEQRIRQDIIRKLQDIFECYGYQPIETPTLCYFDVLASKYAGGAEILKEVYKLVDQGERELGLRYDLTVPFAKLVGMNPDIKMPFKRYEIGKVFRDGPVKLGRNREFIQCDVDMVGVKSQMAEAELIMMAVEVYKALGLEVYISYNNRKYLSGIIEVAGIEAELVGSVILSIDKLEKIGDEAVRLELSALGIEKSKIDKLFKYMKIDFDDMMNSNISNQNNSSLEYGIKELKELKLYFEALEIEDNLRFNPTLARGLEIYTGTVWEVFLTDGSITSSVGAGGRYDKIIGQFLDNGMEYPAVGMTFGLDVIYEALMLKEAVDKKSLIDVFLVPIGTLQSVMKIAKSLRSMGIKVDVDMTGKKLKKSLDYANKQGIPYVAILGEDELQSGTIKLKDMQKGMEREISIMEIGDIIKNLE